MSEDQSEPPLLDELEKGPWPSFVTEMKRAAAKKPAARDALRQLERSYREKIVHWKHGGIVGVRGYGGGVIGRYSDLPNEFPEGAHFHTIRANQPAGWFYTSAAPREWACYDTLDLTYDLTMHYQDEIHRPSMPYKFKIKAAGCPNDCVASI